MALGSLSKTGPAKTTVSKTLSPDDPRLASPSSNSGSGPLGGDVTPKRFGLNYDPPSIILEYLHTDTGKLFHRRIGLRRLRPGADAERVAEKLRQKNDVLLAEDKVSFEQLVSLIKKLQAGLPDSSCSGGAPEEVKAPVESSGKAEMTIHVRCMSGQTVKVSASPGDAVAKVKAALQQQLGVAEQQQELVFGSTTLSDDARALQGYGIRDGAELSLVALDYSAMDLNKLSDEELNKHKALMDVQFLKNQRKPGDPDFVYDVQVDFEPDANSPCGWDSDSGG
eukprot:CAMPEP_0178426962 /NCGR_PEP_ID=MMETSP0689_2-20121128/29501_1 /TAXON_ID=160604 /ORGANISM="Amphidinium massartii, Strain CS-259" /LENGTH=280 /DNA_ID=CAMNT_0020048657 /DNA_START=20 /DNA_END=859 /DNA_ORIENTATION=-